MIFGGYCLALAFIADGPERLDRFLGLAGLRPDAIRSSVQQPGFLLGVLPSTPAAGWSRDCWG
jgi:hypothetical protein